MSIYQITPHCFAINLKEIPSCFVCKLFLWLLCMIKCSNYGSYLDNTNFLAHFGSKCGHLTHLVSMYRVTPHCYAINLEEIPSCFSWMYIWGYFTLSNGPNRKVIWIIPILWIILVQNVAIRPSGSPFIGLPLPPLFYY